jgi:hypothetical protein
MEGVVGLSSWCFYPIVMGKTMPHRIGALARSGVMVLALAALTQGGARATGADYFPKSFFEPSASCPGSSSKVVVINEVEAGWYPRHWQAADEPSLYAQSLSPARSVARTYRFTWLRSFDPPVVVRIDVGADGRMRLVAKQLSGKGGYAPGRIGKQVRRDLSRDEAAGIAAVLDKTHVLDLPPSGCSAVIGLDGAQWIFESSEAGSYRFVNRWSPDAGPAREAGLAFLGLTGWTFDKVY